ncbi:hypothetical protein [Sphingomonas beigongshangi]|uniref:hypothetical protein n=1 Tax=Sphingomonas beigongshangi TaxID=2782540 RepID=UPI001AEE1819|nr:hypothetical protein [Sphingomonas beigongshangi]
MTEKKTPPLAGPDHVRAGKGAAREAIGKLIGDDAEIRKGRTEQAEAEDAPASDPSENSQ